MNFKEMWARQVEQNLNWIPNYKDLTPLEREEWVRNYVLALISELDEVLGVVKFKKNKLYRARVNMDNLLEESIDLFKFVLSIPIVYQIPPEDFFKRFFEKSNVVDERWKKELVRLEETSNVICVDIDGVLADFSAGWTAHLSKVLNRVITPDLHTNYYIHTCIGISKEREEEIKEGWYTNGGFRDLPIYDGVVRGMNGLSKDFDIILVTARPVQEYRRIEVDTHQWLAKWGVPFNFISWGRYKIDQIQQEIWPAKVRWFLEDRLMNAIDLAKNGVQVILFNRPYNQGETPEGVIRVDNWEEAIGIIRG